MKIRSLNGIDEGGGAFYGPKIDIKITDALGREMAVWNDTSRF